MRHKTHIFLLLVFITVPAFVLSCAKETAAPPVPDVAPAPAESEPVAPPPTQAAPEAATKPTPQPTQALKVKEPVAPPAPEKTEPAAAPEAKGPPKQPANHSGRKACLVCHSKGTAGAPKVPANHEGRTDPTCPTCHKAQ